MVKDLENQVDKLNNQARFVQMIIDEELVVSKRKKADIVTELRSLKFRPFPKVSKAKEAGEAIAAVEDDEEEGQQSDYDYLLGMPIWSLTQEKVRHISVLHFSIVPAASTYTTSRSRSYGRSAMGKKRNSKFSSRSLLLSYGTTI